MLTDLVAVSVTYLAVALAAWPLGIYMSGVFGGKRVFLSPVLRPVERFLHWLIGVREDQEQGWAAYAFSAVALGAVGLVFTYLVLRLQNFLPINPQGMSALAPDLAANTAISFTSNTGWESYAGEQTLSYLSQMLAITTGMFLSMAVGMAVAVALIRGFARRESATVGNFWVDAVRAILYVELPLALVVALFLVSQGVVQNLNPYTVAHTMAGGVQLIAQGPVASMEPIKDMSGAGGGFFNTSSAHPFEDPNGLTHQLEMDLQLIIPFALAVTLGRMLGRPRDGIVLAGAMAAILLACTAVVMVNEQGGNPALTAAGVNQARTAQSAGGNMEGKEVRFGPLLSGQFFAAATGSGDGDVDAGYDSLMPLSEMVGLAQMKIGEVTPGGPGSGLYGILIYAIMAVFMAGLMVGRTPEYLGKKIESREMKLVALTILMPGVLVLFGAALSVLLPAGTSTIGNPGPHGLSEILYAFTSTAVQNGSSFAGLNTNNLYYNVALGIPMWAGRFGLLIPVLAVAGSLARKKLVAPGAGTLPTGSPLFATFLVGVVVVVGALTFFVVLALGPILEQLHLAGGRLYG